MLNTKVDHVLEFGKDEVAVIRAGTMGVGGGYGVVYKGWMLDGTPVAVKFMQKVRGAGMTNVKFRRNEARRFKHEIAMVKKLNRLAKTKPNILGYLGHRHPRAWIAPRQFPAYLGEGICRRKRFYVMEWLEPFEFSMLANEYERWNFAVSLCDSVAWLHANGYVHCDLKPSNIMCRPNSPASAVSRYCYVDFGSMHKIEEPGSGKTSGNSLSVVGGIRYSPRTPGYADPLEERHTVFADIYSIGQILRGMFEGDVPVSWAQIITRCTNLRLSTRYQSVEELKYDISNMDEIRKETYKQFKLDEIRRRKFRESQEMPFGPHVGKWEDVLPLEPDRHDDGTVEFFIADYDYYLNKCVCNGIPGNWRMVQSDFTAEDELVLHANEILRLEGGLNFVGKIRGEPGSAVVLSDGATLHNVATTGEGYEVYVVNEGSYLNFRNVAAGGKTAKAISERVFRTHDDVSYFEFGGPETIQQLRERDAARAEKTQLPEKLKSALVDMVKCSGIHEDRFDWKYGGSRP